MKRNFLAAGFFLLFLLITFGMMSCSQDFPLPEMAEDGYMNFHFIKSDTETRAQTDDDNGNGNFELQDQIRLVSTKTDGSDPRYFTLTWNGSQWMPRLTRTQLGEDWRLVHAYYPASDIQISAEKEIELSVLSDQQKPENYKHSDLLWSNSTTLYSDTRDVSLQFKHGYFRVNVDLSDLKYPITDVAVRGKCHGSRNIISETLFPSTEETEFQWIRACRTNPDKAVYRAILFPQTNDYRNWYRKKDLQVRIRVKTETGEKEITYQEPELEEMKSGKQYTIRLSDQPNRDPQFANLKKWVYGVNAPVCPDYIPGNGISPGNRNPEPGVWNFYRSIDNGGPIDREMRCFLPWKKGCGWYDSNKTYDFDQADDAYMCWAASTANLLHWWMNLNRTYIEAYDRKYPEAKADRPSFEYSPDEKSEIFSFLIRVFHNRAGNTEEGIEWFLSGKPGMNLPYIEEENYKYFDGFFPEIFKGRTTVTYHRGLSKKRFNQLIKEALTKNKGIGFACKYPGFGNHAMTIWGAEFDENGDVSYIYYVDNNPSDDEKPQAICLREPIMYATPPEGYQQYEDYAYIKSYTGKLEHAKPILSVELFDLQTETWKENLQK